jgi:hypothetical protein
VCLCRQDTGGIGATVALLLVELLTGLPIRNKVSVYGGIHDMGYLYFCAGVLPWHVNRCFEMGAELVLVDRDGFNKLQEHHSADMDQLAQAGREVRAAASMWEVLKAAYLPFIEDDE